MNDKQFTELAHANPHDTSEEFLRAAKESPERERLVTELKAFDSKLSAALKSVTAQDSLQESLLNIPAGHTVEAANDNSWRRYSALAATLIFAVVIVFQTNTSDPENLEQVVFTHIYDELDFLTMTDQIVTLDSANELMNSLVGGHFEQTDVTRNIEINVAKDCLIALENAMIQGVHMVIKGEKGPMTVMLIPTESVEDEVHFSDNRFDGIISPFPGGNLVVMGEKEEEILQFNNLIAGNISW